MSCSRSVDTDLPTPSPGAPSPAPEDSSPRWPLDVGILAVESYFPRLVVQQAQLEAADGVPAGKYTEGLGQEGMAVCADCEDVISMSLTVVQNLFEKWNIDPASIGRLEVGTESSLDKSKSIKTSLMRLFAASGNSDVEGVDCVSACYGATSALMNAANWIESRAWDGRLALVVAVDVAVYAAGPARPTGGAGAAAVLIGPGAPLALERALSASHSEDTWDFYKPPTGLPYPLVDGALSVSCYLRALDRCYELLVAKAAAVEHAAEAAASRGRGGGGGEDGPSTSYAPPAASPRPGLPTRGVLYGPGSFCRDARASADSPAGAGDPFLSLRTLDHALFHAPYHKLVRKAFARLITADFLRRRAAGRPDLPEDAPLAALGDRLSSPDQMASDRALEAAAMAASAGRFARQALPAALLPRACGNSYTASVFAALASLLEAKGAALEGRRVLLYSFGSGLVASAFVLRGRPPSEPGSPFTCAELQRRGQLAARLAVRTVISPAAAIEQMARLEARYHACDWRPSDAPAGLFPGTFYLTAVDSKYRRSYERVPPAPLGEGAGGPGGTYVISARLAGD